MSKAAHVMSTDPAKARDLHSMRDLLRAWFVLSGCYATVSTGRNSLSRYTRGGSIQHATGSNYAKAMLPFLTRIKAKAESRAGG